MARHLAQFVANYSFGCTPSSSKKDLTASQIHPLLPLTPNSRSYINRFLQPDTLILDAANPQNWNRFAYVRNDPISYNDPSGHCIWDGCIVEGILIGTAISVAVDYAVTKFVLKQDYTWKDAALTAGISVLTGGLAGGASAIAEKFIAKQAISTTAKFVTTLAAKTAINMEVNDIDRRLRHEPTTGRNILFDAIGGVTSAAFDGVKVDDVADFAGEMLEKIPLNHEIPSMIVEAANESVKANKIHNFWTTVWAATSQTLESKLTTIEKHFHNQEAK